MWKGYEKTGSSYFMSYRLPRRISCTLLHLISHDGTASLPYIQNLQVFSYRTFLIAVKKEGKQIQGKCNAMIFHPFRAIGFLLLAVAWF
jgi:hypothetical protein